MTTKSKSIGKKNLKIAWQERTWTPRIRRSFIPLIPQSTVRSCAMKKSVNSFSRISQRAFTLVELLVVIAIIAILAGLLMPALARAKLTALKTQAKNDLQQIKTAIEAYHGEYSRFPSPTNIIVADFTFGTNNSPDNNNPPANFGSAIGGYAADNANLMAILLNENYGANTNYQKNPRKTPFLNVSKRAATTNDAGLGPDLVFRDPWKHPYIVTVDYDYDDHCRDVFYKRAQVSQNNGNQGYYGLSSTNGTDFDLNGAVMAWSLGPDGKAAANAKADKGDNADNILSWGK
jgi:prepilin-type N-terminal cleavage/methylation domain-containing protein